MVSSHLVIAVFIRGSVTHLVMQETIMSSNRQDMNSIASEISTVLSKYLKWEFLVGVAPCLLRSCDFVCSVPVPIFKRNDLLALYVNFTKDVCTSQSAWWVMVIPCRIERFMLSFKEFPWLALEELIFLIEQVCHWVRSVHRADSQCTHERKIVESFLVLL